jgi:hypothetical protein
MREIVLPNQVINFLGSVRQDDTGQMGCIETEFLNKKNRDKNVIPA